MKRKIFAVLLSAVLCLSFAVPALAEGEGLAGGLLGGLLGGVGQAVEGLIPEGVDAGGFLEGLIPKGIDAGGFLKGLIPEGIDAGGFLKGLIPEGIGAGGFLKGLIPEGIDVGGLLGSVADRLGISREAIDAGLGKIAGMLPGMDMGTGTGMDEDELAGALTGMIEEIEAMDAACAAHVTAEYAELLEAGDEQIVVMTVASQITLEDGTQKVLGLFGMENYAAEGNELRLMNFAATPELMTMVRHEDGSFEVTDTKWAADGDDFADSFAALCDEIGADLVDYADLKAEYDWLEASRICDLFGAHPEYGKIEYMGEMKTPEEMKQICGELLDAYTAAGE